MRKLNGGSTRNDEFENQMAKVKKENVNFKPKLNEKQNNTIEEIKEEVNKI